MTDNGMTGKLVLVTGGTGGIGEVAARELARKGAKVVIVGRNPQKTATVAEQIKVQSGNPTVEYLLGDLSLKSEVRRVADEFKQRFDHLDVLLNNAGGFFSQRQVTSEGLEYTFALNHLNYFLLTKSLLEVLNATGKARVVNVSSGAHVAARLNFDDLQNERKYSGWDVYSKSKLMNIYFTYEMARRVNHGLTVNALHPGFVATNFGLNNRWLMGWGVKLSQKLFARTPEQGAQTSIYLASSPEVEDVSGKYFADCRAILSSPVSYDQPSARLLWETSEEMIQS
jgi:NAD(P)-dependent dehydrogenase (short-subunit alcohol dehydrogenase family)